MQRRLLRVERTIGFYRKTSDELTNEVNIDVIPLDFLLTVIKPNPDDPLLYDGYILSEMQLSKINEQINKAIVVDFEHYYYVLECAGIYD